MSDDMMTTYAEIEVQRFEEADEDTDVDARLEELEDELRGLLQNSAFQVKFIEVDATDWPGKEASL